MTSVEIFTDFSMFFQKPTALVNELPSVIQILMLFSYKIFGVNYDFATKKAILNMFTV